jgi:hypothetical protein
MVSNGVRAVLMSGGPAMDVRESGGGVGRHPKPRLELRPACGEIRIEDH